MLVVELLTFTLLLHLGALLVGSAFLGGGRGSAEAIRPGPAEVSHRARRPIRPPKAGGGRRSDKGDARDNPGRRETASAESDATSTVPWRPSSPGVTPRIWEIVAVNDSDGQRHPGSSAQIRFHPRRLPEDVSPDGEDTIVIGGATDQGVGQEGPAPRPGVIWGVDVVVESTGIHQRRQGQGHLAGAKRSSSRRLPPMKTSPS